ncbi:MAG TPA: aminotransferase class IV family protein [Ensifer sp.]|nr:aminotransferase class IV family protein [Ensifer sp.]
MPSPPLWGRWRQPEGVFTANAEQAEGKPPPQPSPQGGGGATAAPHPISPLAGEGGAAPTSLQRLRLELSPSGKIAVTSAPFSLQTDDTIWRIAFAKTRTASTDPLIRHKTTRRALYEAARAEFPTDKVNDVILLNEKGELAEGTITNLFVEDDQGGLMTPPISSGCLAGVLRTSLICARKAYNHRLRPEDLNGRSLYVGNSLRGLIRAELIGK